MLRLKNITKSYTTAGFTQNALDGVSVAFRDNEFAAVLGPSGSGKTTMLNIVGGLDRYDSGDLEIDNISTEKYKANDWDTYRNNRIGFVFQSYNLIPHQSVLANVELALTLSGVSKRERRKRAKKALEEVGLAEHIRKKPGQMSGGQMQRVAIARALINDPEILLADEPTGALDTTTSKQVMELLTEIAKDRLVIMVTHNNELAEEYANRIIQLKDGKVKSDSRPFDPSAEGWRVGREPRRASMSFWTAIMLSFSNLMTKKGRTITTAFAGSIGIIGIGCILALSNGINEYIRNIEEETLSVYPLVITDQGFDLSGFFGGNDDDDNNERRERPPRPPDTIREFQIMETVFSTASINDLAALKEYLEANRHRLDAYVSTIHYMYSITPQIFLADTSDGVDQVNPDSIFSGLMGAQDSFGGGQDAMSFMPSMNVFSEMPNDPALYDSQYDVLIGQWPQSYDEAVLVVSHGAGLTDFILYSMGLRDRAEMKAMLESVMNRTDMEVEITESEGIFTYDTFMDMVFKVIHPAELFQYDETFDVWVDKSGDCEYMRELVDNGIPLKIVGIVQPNEDASATVLSMGVNYTPQLIIHLMEQAADKAIVREQLLNPEVNVISGNTFEYEQENPESSFDFSKIMSVDEDLFRDAMQLDSLMDSFDFGEMDFGDMDFSDLDFSDMDFSDLDFGEMDMSNFDFSDMDLSSIEFGDLGDVISDMGDPDINIDIEDIMPIITGAIVGQDEMNRIMATEFLKYINTLGLSELELASLMLRFLTEPDVVMAEHQAGFMAYIMGLSAEEQNALLAQLIDMEKVGAGIARLIGQNMESYMRRVGRVMEREIQKTMGIAMKDIGEQIGSAVEEAMTEVTEQIANTMEEAMAEVGEQMESAMRKVVEQLEGNISSAFEELSGELESSMDDFDGEALASAFQIEIGEDEIFELMSSIMNPSASSFEQTLIMLGYADPDDPTQILIYPRSFDAKQEVLDTLERYNNRMEESGKPEKVVHFTDIVGLMMSTVTDVIDMVSYALVAFVSVALVVSSIMIGVITFISVLERKKEIGILRAVGASKGNIRLVFNAETLIIGFVAGVIGVLATYAISFVANIILYNELGIRQLVIMPPVVPVILVMISMFLTYIAGLIPASAAASKAPVEALRSE